MEKMDIDEACSEPYSFLYSFWKMPGNLQKHLHPSRVSETEQNP